MALQGREERLRTFLLIMCSHLSGPFRRKGALVILLLLMKLVERTATSNGSVPALIAEVESQPLRPNKQTMS